MKKKLDELGVEQGTFWGILLILGGVLFLLQSIDLFDGLIDSFWSLLGTVAFGIGGVAFLTVFLANPKSHWWAAIPGFTLLGLLFVSIADYLGSYASDLSGGFFLASIGLGFLAVYLFNRELWWAIIPFGVMTTLGIVSVVDEFTSRWEVRGFDSGFIFFIGLGITFLLVALLNINNMSTRWAFIPAAALLMIGLFNAVSMGGLLNYIWPLALIGGGLFLVVRSRKGNKITSV